MFNKVLLVCSTLLSMVFVSTVIMPMFYDPYLTLWGVIGRVVIGVVSFLLLPGLVLIAQVEEVRSKR